MRKSKEKNSGITLIALIITIIVLLIIAGISIGALTGNNGIIKGANNTKEKTEINEEKEIVEISVVQAVGKNKYGNLTKQGLEKKLDDNSGGREIKLYSGENEYVVVFLDTKRVYIVDSEENITQGDSSIINADSTPGDITKGEDGRTLAGTEQDPYIIMSIEDLVTMSKLSNTGNTLKNKYIKFGRDLNFKSELSYCNYETTEYNEYLEIDEELRDELDLKEALTNEKYKGFKSAKEFSGTLDGDGKVIKNIYINKETNAGLFSSGGGLKILNLELTGKIVTTGDYCGGFCGQSGTIVNCISRVNIEATGNNIGGLIGQNGSTNNCIYYGNISGSANTVGGLIGNSGSCTNSKNYGNILGVSKVGGLNGQGGTVRNSFNFGKVSGTSNVGGMVGINGNCTECENRGEIAASGSSAGGIQGQGGNSSKCKNYGKVSANAYAAGINGCYGSGKECENYGDIIVNNSHAGGIVGHTNGKIIDKCKNYGNISGNKWIGGIVGTHGVISNCINKGEITAKSNACGGISGYITITKPIINCVNAGKVSCPTRTGGIVGAADFAQGENSKLINCYNVGTIIGNSNIGEIAGNKNGYGTHYIVNCYGIIDSGNPLYGNNWTVTNCVGYTKEYMKTNEFLKILNDYVEEYNAGEDKSASSSIDLLGWNFDEETGYPTLDFPG